MNDTQELGNGEPLAQEARALVSRLVSGEATVADLETARHWRNQSAIHEAAFSEAVRLWDRLEPAARNVLKRNSAVAPVFRTPGLATRRMLLGGGSAVLASTAAYLIVRPPFDLWPSLSELRADYRTATGEQRRIETSNGASVEMNTATSINLRPMAMGHVRIDLIAGETAIMTNSRTAGAIVVVVENGRIRASNAKFNVRLDKNGVCVSCLDGMVQVEVGDRILALKAPQQVNYTGLQLGAPLTIDPTLVSAWQTGVLIFHGQPLADVVAEINRYRPGRIILLNADMGRQPVNARFHIAHADEIMSLVQRIFGAHVEKLPGGLVFLS